MRTSLYMALCSGESVTSSGTDEETDTTPPFGVPIFPKLWFGEGTGLHWAEVGVAAGCLDPPCHASSTSSATIPCAPLSGVPGVEGGGRCGGELPGAAIRPLLL
mmetsp:Transcript_23232/g.55876  ORF Transcript_23232/g.55876 Transcript_23232/m.55876 type:complete len:104 (-) Transcript_23232:19-330(-)